MSSHVQDRVNELMSWVKQGKIIEALDEFYGENVSMQENRNEPTVGREPNRDREHKFLAQIKDFHGFDTTAIGVEGGEGGTGTALIESWMEFTNTEGQKVRLEQVSRQKWENGVIVDERFYYDSAG